MLNEILLKRLLGFSQEYRDFIMSDFTEAIGLEVQRVYLWNDEKREAFENMLFLHIALFLNRIEFIEAIVTECSLPIPDAINLAESVLSKLPNEMQLAQKKAYISLTETDNVSIAENDRLEYLQTLPLMKLIEYIYTKTSSETTKILNHYSLTTEEIVTECRNLLGDIILGFYKIEDTVPLLQQELGLDAKTAALLGADVLDFLAPLSDPNWQPPVEIDEEGILPSVVNSDTSPNQADNSPSVSVFDYQSNIPDPEHELPQLRTMAADMLEERSPARNAFNPVTTLEEPLYQSNQPEITKSIAPVPSYTAPLYETAKPNIDAPLEKPRWG